VKKAKKNNTRPTFDKDGNWVEEQSQIKGAMRQVFRFSPQFKHTHDSARVELPPKLKKDGTPGKLNQVFYRCAICKNLFKSDVMKVDHIVPVVPLYRKESDMSYDELARAIFCKIDNLQLVCDTPMSKLPKGERSCHYWKTQKENWIRDRYFERKNEPRSVKQALSETVGDVLREIESEYEIFKQKQLQELAEKAEKRKLREAKLNAKLNKIK
jgi:hypothetical protein